MNRRRRELIRLLLGAGAFAGGAAVLGGCTRNTRPAGPHVVVVGGGYGGSGCARYLKLLDPGIRVTLVEPKQHFVTCPFSNAYLAGLRPYRSLVQSYEALSRRYDVDVVHARATHLDADRRTLFLNNGGVLDYDRLVVSPGIGMRWNVLPEGYDERAAELMPHAWNGGPQTRLLHDMLRDMQDGGLIAIAVPPPPFRCPPGPFERASLMAHYLKQHKPRSKVLILNADNHFSKQDLFLEAWEDLYGDMIEVVPVTRGGLVSEVDPRRGALHTNAGVVRPDIANIIPAQQAGDFARDNGLIDDTGWCPVDHLTFESRRVPGVHVLGDSCLAGAMPKSASSANSQAKVCSLALVALLRDREPAPPVYHNTCYSLIAPDYGFSVNAMYRYRNERITLIQRAGGLSPLKADREVRRKEARYARDWYASINADTFGAGGS